MGMQTVWVFGNTADILKKPKPQVEGYLTYGGGEPYLFVSFPGSYLALHEQIWQMLMETPPP